VLGGSRPGVFRWTSVSVKLLLSPRQSRVEHPAWFLRRWSCETIISSGGQVGCNSRLSSTGCKSSSHLSTCQGQGAKSVGCPFWFLRADSLAILLVQVVGVIPHETTKRHCQAELLRFQIHSFLQTIHHVLHGAANLYLPTLSHSKPRQHQIKFSSYTH